MKTSETFKKIITDINTEGDETQPRDKKVRELINYTSKIENAENLAFDFESRKFSWKYLAAELIWYISGDLNTENIGEYAKLWKEISDESGNINSNYGYIVLQRLIKDYGNQYKYILEKLKEDKDSRQALIRYNSDSHVYKGNKDFVCTISNQFLIRDNKIHMIINMRSQDIFYGWQFDIVWFGLLLQSFRLDLLDTYHDLQLGNIYHNSGSIHIYENMFNKADSIEKEEPIKDYYITLNESLLTLFDKIKNNKKLYRDKLSDYKSKESEFIGDNLSINIK